MQGLSVVGVLVQGLRLGLGLWCRDSVWVWGSDVEAPSGVGVMV